MKKMYSEILSQLKGGNPIVLASVYKSSGSTPRKAGAKMAYFSNSEISGTVGGGALEHDCILTCQNMKSGDGPFSKVYTLNHNDAGKLGMVCGGEIHVHFMYIEPSDDNIALFEHIEKLTQSPDNAWLVTCLSDNIIGTYDKGNGFFNISPETDITDMFRNTATVNKDETYYTEPLSQRSTVYVFGGGHISQALCPLLCATDFRVTVYEDNEKFAQKELFPDDVRIVNSDFSKIGDNITITNDDYAVVLTRGHKWDNEVISQILSADPTYLGVIGSKKKVAFMKEYLIEKGFDKSQVDSIHSPIGLDIGATTPAEIAVSITAQLISHRAKLNNTN